MKLYTLGQFGIDPEIIYALGIASDETVSEGSASGLAAVEVDRLDSLLLSDCTHVAIVNANQLADVLNNIHELCQELSDESGFAVLLTRKQPPLDHRRFDGVISSFFCTIDTWQDGTGFRTLEQPEKWCFSMLHSIMNGTISVSRLYVRQLSETSKTTEVISEFPRTNLTVVIAHRGPVNYLRQAIKYCGMLLDEDRLVCRVGLDLEDIEQYQDVGHAILYSVERNPAGPYVIRQALIEKSTEDLVLFQDSDDVPCSDRASVLRKALEQKNVDMIGSHELEVNEIDHTVRIYRFPLDVSGVLSDASTSGVSDNALEPFLHATALVKRDKFLMAGGFSTNRRIANDSQFLLRAHFSMKIANVDAFLYLRRVHARALTVDPETRNGNLLRKQLSSKWGSDFKKVKLGELSLEESSLSAEKEQPPRQIELIVSR